LGYFSFFDLSGHGVSWAYAGGSENGTPPAADHHSFWWDDVNGDFEDWLGDVYIAFWNHWVYTTGPVLGSLKWLKSTFGILGWMNAFYKWMMGLLVGTVHYHEWGDNNL